MSRRTFARAAPMRFRRRRSKAAVSIFASRLGSLDRGRGAGAARRRRASPRASSRCPASELFFEQDESYRAQVIGDAPVRVGVEAAVRQGWDALIGDGPFIGMTGFGASGPYKAALRAFRHHARRAVADSRRWRGRLRLSALAALWTLVASAIRAKRRARRIGLRPRSEARCCVRTDGIGSGGA